MFSAIMLLGASILMIISVKLFVKQMNLINKGIKKKAKVIELQGFSYITYGSERNKIYNVDTSAAAISACGMLTLYELGGSTDMLSFAVKTLEALSAEYVNRNVNVPGILKYQNGQKSYTTYGDYFYTELLLKVLYNIDICW